MGSAAPVSAGAGGAAGDGAWGYTQSAAGSTWGVGAPGALHSMPGDAGAYGHAPYGQTSGRIQLAPLRDPVGQGQPAGERSAQGSGGKKNPLSIGNIISEDTS
ncbi:hypothetical protein WOLCODRAFT_153309 [Wolfiporia cocos MD-104 SS10]|uniref:Uncharacterized protein n=1 Tax=Wolfiporia cocos (strain MD-104) TaxID=742152 RepID=A0A2H3JM23_WOLCO|nr:hypothetical protein WOLCODRAFT_153309 [Wolfiporia cocos MD-104 SS10]